MLDVLKKVDSKIHENIYYRIYDNIVKHWKHRAIKTIKTKWQVQITNSPNNELYVPTQTPFVKCKISK